MSIKDARERLAAAEAGLPSALTPRPIFLWCAATAAVAALLVFINQDRLVDPAQTGSSTAFAMVLVFLVLIAAFFIVCFRSPALGNRFLGYAGLMKGQDRAVDREDAASLNFTRTNAVDTGLEAKRRSTKRKTARHQRKHIAQITRDMQRTDQAADPSDQT